MSGLKILFFCFITFCFTNSSAQVKVRLFSSMSPESVVFSVTEGIYEVTTYNAKILRFTKGDPLVIIRYNGKLAIKARNEIGIVCDSVSFEGKTGNDSFSIMISGNTPVKQYYSNDLKCFPDMETIVLINICDIEKYISGVVRAEGGTGKSIEYFKTQALIARTYMYKYFDKHLFDRYNVCDNTHCQAFNGLGTDSVINRGVAETRNLVIVTPDSTLIIAAFHSNCGGETASSEDAWLTSQPYLRKVVDPYCRSERNALWEIRFSINGWLDYLKESGYKGISNDPDAFSFVQKSRLTEYRSGSFSMPLKTIRAEKNLRSTFFSVVAERDSILLKGRGYGHGVGLCQEGAMVMASKGFNYKQIINFYYPGVIIVNIKNAVILPGVLPPGPLYLG